MQNLSELISLFSLLDTFPMPVMLNKKAAGSDGTELNDEIVYLNDAFVQTFGFEKQDIPTDQEWLKKAFPDAGYHDFVMDEWFKAVGIAQASDTHTLGYPAKITTKDGEQLWFHMTTQMDYPVLDQYRTLIFSPVAEPDSLQAEIDSVNQTRTNEQALLKAIIDLVPAGVAWQDKNLVYLGCNQTFAKDAGYERSKQLIGKTDYHLPWAESAEFYITDAKQILSSGHARLNYYETHPQEDGTMHVYISSKSPIRDNSDEIVGLVSTYFDVTEQVQNKLKLIEQNKELKAHTELLDYHAHYDSLTDLPNRTLLMDRVNHSIKRIEAEGGTRKIALLLLDLDRFKSINDSFGHSIGDLVIKEVVKRFNEILDEADAMARIGGDEFVILLEESKNSSDPTLISKALIESFKTPLKVLDHELFLSTSIGISVYPSDGASAEILLRNADTAMYQAKAAGKSTYSYYKKEMTQRAYEHVFMENGLRQAVTNDEIEVFFQPQCDGITHHVIGAEALVRWQHPTIGMIPPDHFIPLAEEMGLIVEIDRAVMRRTMQYVVKWRQANQLFGRVSMNLAVGHLESPDFLPVFNEMLSITNCRPSWLTLEITETEIMKDPKKSLDVLQQLHDMGVELAIDDFGTGYSSLTLLSEMPVSKLKIDRSFVMTLSDKEEDQVVIKTIISLAQNLGIHLVAEGVETAMQQEFLLQHDCSIHQGYLYSKPISAEEFGAQFLVF